MSACRTPGYGHTGYRKSVRIAILPMRMCGRGTLGRLGERMERAPRRDMEQEKEKMDSRPVFTGAGSSRQNGRGMGYRLGEDKGGRASLRRWLVLRGWWKRGGLLTATRFLGFATLRSEWHLGGMGGGRPRGTPLRVINNEGLSSMRAIYFHSNHGRGRPRGTPLRGLGKICKWEGRCGREREGWVPASARTRNRAGGGWIPARGPE